MKTEKNNTESFAGLSPDLNKLHNDCSRIHLMGICGTGMASMAGLLKQKGFRVTGSDQNIYPPMSDLINDLSIPILEGYSPQNLHPVPDLVIVGNVITKFNPEAIELSRLGIPYLSFPQALRAFAMKGHRSIVVSGTHGKTTTTGLVSWALETAGLDPGLMVGGLLNNFKGNFKIGSGPYFVIEGDEYDTAFFDKGPKFLHYSPTIVILTGIEFDHADIYRDLEHVIENFRKLIDLIPQNGLLIANSDDRVLMDESAKAKCPVITYGFGENAHWKAENIDYGGKLTRIDISHQGGQKLRIMTPLYGRHNIANLLSSVALSSFLGIAHQVISKAAKSFKGVKRRQEIKGEIGGVLIIDDFAHHPTAVRETIAGVKERYSGRRLMAVFEPRSNSSRRNIFQEKYSLSFDGADIILIPEPVMMDKIPEEERFSSEKLVRDLKKNGANAFYASDSENLLQKILGQLQKGDVILIMSNGSFESLPSKLLAALENL